MGCLKLFPPYLEDQESLNDAEFCSELLYLWYGKAEKGVVFFQSFLSPMRKFPFYVWHHPISKALYLYIIGMKD